MLRGALLLNHSDPRMQQCAHRSKLVEKVGKKGLVGATQKT